MPRLSPSSESPAEAASRIESDLAALYLVGRQRSRDAGVQRLAEEVEVYTGRPPPVGDPYRSRAVAAEAEYEVERSRRAAKGYAGAWYDDAVAALDEGADDAFGVATRGQLWRLEMGATTESAEAFNLARDQAIQQLLVSDPGLADELVKIWDANLDKLTCPICGEASGTIVRLNESFPQGLPGHVHPHCRCVEQILPLSIALQRGGAKAPSPEPQAEQPAMAPAKPASKLPKQGAAEKHAATEAKRAAAAEKKAQAAAAKAAKTAERARVAAEKKAAAAAKKSAAEAKKIAREEARRVKALEVARRKAEAEAKRAKARAAREAKAKAAKAKTAKAKKPSKPKVPTPKGKTPAQLAREAERAKKAADVAAKKEAARIAREQKAAQKAAEKTAAEEQKSAAKAKRAADRAAKVKGTKPQTQIAKPVGNPAHDPAHWLAEYTRLYGDEAGAAVAHGRAMFERGLDMPVDEVLREAKALRDAGFRGINYSELQTALGTHGNAKLRDIYYIISDGNAARSASAAAIVAHTKAITPTSRSFVGTVDIAGAGQDAIAFRVQRTTAERFYSLMADSSLKLPDESWKFTFGRVERSYCKSSQKLIELDRKVDVSIFSHEVGHAIDAINPESARRALSFLEGRTSGEVARKMSDITSDSRYAATEVAKPDKFVTPYMGKVYNSSSVSEVTSTCVEYLSSNAAWLFDRDRLSFFFGLGTLRNP